MEAPQCMVNIIIHLLALIYITVSMIETLCLFFQGCGRILLISGLLVAFLSFIMIGPTPLIQDLHR
jgi:hypothetical protein